MFSKALCSWCESVVSMFSLPSVRISAHFEQNRTEQMLLSSLLPLHSPPSPCGYCIWFLLYQLLTQKENTCPEQSFETSFRTHSSNWSFVESTVMYCSIYSILFFLYKHMYCAPLDTDWCSASPPLGLWFIWIFITSIDRDPLLKGQRYRLNYYWLPSVWKMHLSDHQCYWWGCIKKMYPQNQWRGRRKSIAGVFCECLAGLFLSISLSLFCLLVRMC